MSAAYRELVQVIQCREPITGTRVTLFAYRWKEYDAASKTNKVGPVEYRTHAEEQAVKLPNGRFKITTNTPMELIPEEYAP